MIYGCSLSAFHKLQATCMDSSFALISFIGEKQNSFECELFAASLDHSLELSSCQKLSVSPVCLTCGCAFWLADTFCWLFLSNTLPFSKPSLDTTNRFQLLDTAWLRFREMTSIKGDEASISQKKTKQTRSQYNNLLLRFLGWRWGTRRQKLHLFFLL